MTSVNLSAATKLEHLVFRLARPNAQWITTALQTVESKGLQRITLHPTAETFVRIKWSVRQQWRDLDRMLVQFWASHSIRPNVTYVVGLNGGDMRYHAPSLLPELTRRGLVDLVDCYQ